MSSSALQYQSSTAAHACLAAETFGREHFSVVKVADLDTLEDKWTCVGNDAADIAANPALSSQPRRCW